MIVSATMHGKATLSCFCFKLFPGEKLQLEVTVVEKNGAKATYQPDYENINSAPANAFAESFTKEVHLKP